MSDLAISSLLLDKGSFDVVLMDVTWLPKYAASDWLVPLDQYINKTDRKNLPNFILSILGGNQPESLGRKLPEDFK